MNNLSASIDPHYCDPSTVTEQITTDTTGPTALVAVLLGRLTIQSCDAAALRDLSEKIDYAARRIDILNGAL